MERRIQRRDIARALVQLDAIAGEAASAGHPAVTAFLRCIVGDAESKQGRFSEAVTAYALVRSAYPEHQEGRLLARGVIGEIRSLLRLSDVESALTRAAALIEVAALPQPPFSPPADGSPMEVHTVLPSASLVAARLAGFFRREGYQQEAESVLALAPPGDEAIKARRERAEQLARAGHASEAEALLLNILEKAASRQRTLSVKAWQLLIQVRRDQSKVLLLPHEVTGIGAIPGKRLRARSALAVIHQMRQAGDSSWRNLVQDWGLTDPPTPAASRLAAARLLLAEVRRELTDFAEMRRLADAIMANPTVTADDYIAAARAALFAAIKGAGAATPLPMANAAGRKFGPSVRIAMLHSLAKTAVEAGQSAGAIALYQKVRQESTPHARRRGQATHSLAVLEMERGNFAGAASLSEELAGDTTLSPEFRLLALDRQCSALRRLGRQAELESARARLDTLLPGELPPSTLIRMARFARLSGEWGSDGIYAPLLRRAVTATLNTVAGSPHPGPALTVLLELNRKLFWDFYEHQQVWTIWQDLGAERREWLWTERSAFWEYVSLVLRACGKLRRAADVEALYGMATRDAPPEALPFVAVALGDHRRENRRWAEALEAYANAVQAHPTHMECARAHYWLALQARREGRETDGRSSFSALRQSLGNAVALLWHWELDARALLVLNQFDTVAVASLSRYNSDFLTTQLSALQADEAALASL